MPCRSESFLLAGARISQSSTGLAHRVNELPSRLLWDSVPHSLHRAANQHLAADGDLPLIAHDASTLQCFSRETGDQIPTR